MATPSKNRVAIKNVRIFDGHGLTESTTVVIDGNVIGDASEEADEVINGYNGVLLPGLIDAHVHLHHELHLQELTKYGVTTSLDMACWPAEKMNALRNKTGVSDVRSAGLPVTKAGSKHAQFLPLPDEAMLSGPEQATDFVQKRVEEGSDYIKLICDIPGPSQETLNAVAQAAHEKDKQVVAHAAIYTAFQMALDARANIITHAPLDKAVDDDMVETMTANKVVSVPTLIMMQEVANLDTPSYENAKTSVAKMYQSGIPILAGSDCHEEESSRNVKHGASMHQELELLVDAGMPTVDVLRAATILPAKHFNLHDRGSIEAGKRADLVLLRDDPIKDIRATRSIVRVWCNGEEIQGPLG